MRLVILGLTFLIAVCEPVYAQTVSILNKSKSPESILVEASMKRLLRAEGYTVKGGTVDGYIVVLQAMGVQNKAGHSIGVVGAVSVSTVTWQELADAILTEECRNQHDVTKQFDEVLGPQVVYIGETMGIGADAEEVSELLSLYVNDAVRVSSAKVQELIRGMERATREKGLNLQPDATY
jgi:hypothetical protein